MLSRVRLVSRTLLGLFIAAALMPAPAFAQFDTSTVLGAVKDSSGAVVPGATVTLKNNATGITATAVTDTDGAYQFLNVRVGTYSVRAELQGFSIEEIATIQEASIPAVKSRLSRGREELRRYYERAGLAPELASVRVLVEKRS